jgi:predicted O-methyltransferase YrrM
MIGKYSMLTDEMKEQLKKFILPMSSKGRLLETGTGYAHSAKFFSELKPQWTIYTVDSFGLYGDGRIYGEWKHDEIKEVNECIRDCKNVIQVLGDSSTVPWELPLDVLYIDADHTYEGCKADFKRYAQHVKPGGLIILDDYVKHNTINRVSEFADLLPLPVMYKGQAIIFRKPNPQSL